MWNRKQKLMSFTLETPTSDTLFPHCLVQLIWRENGNVEEVVTFIQIKVFN